MIPYRLIVKKQVLKHKVVERHFIDILERLTGSDGPFISAKQLFVQHLSCGFDMPCSEGRVGSAVSVGPCGVTWSSHADMAPLLGTRSLPFWSIFRHFLLTKKCYNRF